MMDSQLPVKFNLVVTGIWAKLSSVLKFAPPSKEANNQ